MDWMCCIYFKGTKITLDLGTVGTPILTIMHNEALPVAKFSACGRKINHSVSMGSENESRFCIVSLGPEEDQI